MAATAEAYLPPPPPYTSPELKPALSSSPSSSQITTPLPSYTASPTLPPAISSSLSPPKLALPAHDATTATTNLLPTPTSKWDIAWYILLNILGFSFTLIQLPLAILLAAEFNQPGSSPSSISPYIKSPRWIRHITQAMWDLHDLLEEAELHPPSKWS